MGLFGGRSISTKLVRVKPAMIAACVPTAENIALHIADRLKAPIADLGASLHKIRLQESPNNAAEIYAEPAQV